MLVMNDYLYTNDFLYITICALTIFLSCAVVVIAAAFLMLATAYCSRQAAETLYTNACTKHKEKETQLLKADPSDDWKDTI